MTQGRTATTLDPLCRCGHAKTEHRIIGGLDPFRERGSCFGKVDKRPLTAGGDLSPCDCLKYEPMVTIPLRGPIQVTFGV